LLIGLLHAGLDLAFVFQVLLSLRKEKREKNEREDKERHGTPDAQFELSALSLTHFTVCHLSSSQGHIRSSFLAPNLPIQRSARSSCYVTTHLVRDYTRPRRR
jgi:hypothetical protein